MVRYSFRQCTLTLLDRLFGLRQTFASQPLQDWVTTDVALSSSEQGLLQALRTLLTVNAPGWNEQELALQFIGPLFSFVNFTEPYRFNLFAERRISAIIPGLEHDVELSGEPDSFIATGFREPEIPMFAFSEYKRQLDPEGDPAGQTLAAMLVAQRLDQRPKPIYGCYVIGHDWRFLVLEGKHYTLSQDYSAITNDIHDIFRILKALKIIILNLTVPDMPS